MRSLRPTARNRRRLPTSNETTSREDSISDVGDTGDRICLDSSLCKACGICVALCPKNVLQADGTGVPVVASPRNCTGCRICELHCPDFAISIKLDDRQSNDGDEEPD